jgi:phage terminase small subunit
MNATGHKLSGRQERFCQVYAATGIAQRAATEAGYSITTARAQSGRLLANVGVATRIRALTQDGEAATFADGSERRQFWTRVMRGDTGATMAERLRASELLGKASGDFLDRLEHSGQLVTLNLNLAGPSND